MCTQICRWRYGLKLYKAQIFISNNIQNDYCMVIQFCPLAILRNGVQWRRLIDLLNNVVDASLMSIMDSTHLLSPFRTGKLRRLTPKINEYFRLISVAYEISRFPLSISLHRFLNAENILLRPLRISFLICINKQNVVDIKINVKNSTV